MSGVKNYKISSAVAVGSPSIQIAAMQARIVKPVKKVDCLILVIMVPPRMLPMT